MGKAGQFPPFFFPALPARTAPADYEIAMP
jgi:hypothetical protein